MSIEDIHRPQTCIRCTSHHVSWIIVIIRCRVYFNISMSLKTSMVRLEMPITVHVIYTEPMNRRVLNTYIRRIPNTTLTPSSRSVLHSFCLLVPLFITFCWLFDLWRCMIDQSVKHVFTDWSRRKTYTVNVLSFVQTTVSSFSEEPTASFSGSLHH